MNASKCIGAGVMLAALTLVPGCCRPDDIDADPDCPAGRLASATLAVTGELDGIRPVNADKNIRVRGNRVSDDPCIEAGAVSAFSIHLEGDAVDSETIVNLAPGTWSLNVTALSGGDHPAIDQPLTLPVGGSVALTVTSTDDGGMVLE